MYPKDLFTVHFIIPSRNRTVKTVQTDICVNSIQKADKKYRRNKNLKVINRYILI